MTEYRPVMAIMLRHFVNVGKIVDRDISVATAWLADGQHRWYPKLQMFDYTCHEENYGLTGQLASTSVIKKKLRPLEEFCRGMRREKAQQGASH